jgi:hypothetical protein
VVIAVPAVRMVEVPTHEVVHVPGVWHALVAALRAVHVRFLVAAAGMIGRTVRPVHARVVGRMIVHVIP